MVLNKIDPLSTAFPNDIGNLTIMGRTVSTNKTNPFKMVSTEETA